MRLTKLKERYQTDRQFRKQVDALVPFFAPDAHEPIPVWAGRDERDLAQSHARVEELARKRGQTAAPGGFPAPTPPVPPAPSVPRQQSPKPKPAGKKNTPKSKAKR